MLFGLFLIRVKNQVENTCLEAQISGNERKMIACVLSYSLTVYVIITPLFFGSKAIVLSHGFVSLTMAKCMYTV